MKQKYIDAFMDVAYRFSELSSAVRLKVGAIIVKDDRIISIGYNGMPVGWNNECEYQDYDMLGYVTRFPKKVKWDPISFVVIDTYDSRALGTVLGNMLHKFQTTSYRAPTNIISKTFYNLSKQSLMSDFGNMYIRTLDPDGNIVDTWRIYNPMVSKITPSELNYSQEELTSITVELTYDWAEYYLGSDIRPGKIAQFGIDKIFPPKLSR